MGSSGLWHDIKKNPVILVTAIGLHLVALVLLSSSLTSSDVPESSAPTRKTVKAMVVDEKKVVAEIEKLKQAENSKKKKKLAQQKKVKRETDKAKKNLATLKKKQVEEKKKLATLKKKQAEEKKKVAAEKSRKEKENKARQAKETEKKRKQEAADLKRKMEDEVRREREAQMAAEHNEALKSLRAQYVKLIEQKVARNWLRPTATTADMSCEVAVTQTSLGDVISVKLKNCSENKIFQRSIEHAVRKASPLPSPPDPEVFDREINFMFRPSA
jgi:colicin import membrane protein